MLIVDSEIVDYEFKLPFTYLHQVIDNNHSSFDLPVSSTWVRLGAQKRYAAEAAFCFSGIGKKSALQTALFSCKSRFLAI
jgi:hypothetical protein